MRASLILSALGALPAAGQQVTSTWDPAVLDGLWSKPTSWIDGHVPVAGSEVRLNASGDGEVTARFDAGTSPTYGAMYLQYAGTGTARFTLRLDDPLAHLVSQSMSVGSVGAGASARVVQTQGIVATLGLSLGDGEKASGGYDLGGGTLRVRQLSVGMYGAGTFDQSGGGITFTGPDGIDVGVFEGSSGTFTLGGGDAMTVPVLHVGMAGTGSFAQRAGSITVTSGGDTPVGGFSVGTAAGGVGTYELDAGASLTTYNDARVGGDGTGTFNQYGGTSSIGGQRGLILGDGATGDGTYTLSGGTLTANFDIGHSTGARGLFTQSGGSVTAGASNIGLGGSGRVEMSGGTFSASHMDLGTAAGGHGSFELSAGTLTVTGRQTIGGAGTGSFVQTGGTSSVGDLWLAAPAGGVSSYALSGGQLKSAGNEYVANGGTVRFVQTGGTNTAGDFRVGNGNGADGEYDLKGGDLNVGQLLVGFSGTGRLVYSGGRLTFTGGSGMTVGRAYWGSGSFTMTNGATVASIPWISVADGLVEHASGAITLTSTLFQALVMGKGTYNLRDGASLTASTMDEIVGNGSASQATFNQYGGANTVGGSGRLLIGWSAGTGTYNLSGGTLTANINLGWSGGLLHQTGGSLISGTVSVNYGATVDLDGAAADFRTTDLIVGKAYGGNVKMRAGTARVSGTLSVESHAGSRLDQTGGSLTVGKLTVGASGTPGGTVTLQGGLLEAGTIDVRNGALTQTGGTLRAGGMGVSGGAVTLGGVQEWASGSTLTASGGALTLASDAGSAQGANLAVEVVGATAAFGGRQHLRSLHVGSAGAVTSGDVLVTRELTVDGAGRLDLNRGGLVVDYEAGGASPLADVVAGIVAGRAGGGWDGAGVTSSAAASTAGVAVGYGEAAQLLGPSGGMFMGEAVDGTAVLARVTRAGDANLDGKVGFEDLLRLAKHYGADVSSSAAGGAWVSGDFTYDGVVNFADLLALAKNYGAAAPSDPIPGTDVAFQADVAEAFAAVPEPATGGLIGGVLACCAARRGRRRRRR